MPSANLLFFLAFWLSFSSTRVYSEKSRQDTYSDGGSSSSSSSSSSSAPNACANCSICQYPCSVQSPPPPSGFPAAPPPPSPPPPAAQVNCPPAAPVVVCCQNGTSVPFYNNVYPYGNFSGPIPNLAGVTRLPSTSMWLSAAALIFIVIISQV